MTDVLLDCGIHAATAVLMMLAVILNEHRK